MTRAPASQSFWEQVGAATACSRVTTSRPSNGRTALIAPGHPQHVLTDIAQDQVRADRSDLVESRLAKLALDVVFLGKAEAAMGLHAGLARRPARLGGQHLAHIRLLPAVLAGLE